MRAIITLLLITTSQTCCFGQIKKVSIEIIYSKYNNQILIRHDSIIEVSPHAQVGQDAFQIKFFNAFFDEADCKMRLIGKSCYKDTLKCEIGWPVVQVFKARYSNGNLFDLVVLGEALETNDRSSHAHFDVSFSLKRSESLFFYHPGYYLEEYKLGELFREGILSCQGDKK